MSIERDTMEYDVVVVGAGPAGLSAAIRIKQLHDHWSVAVLEKAATIGGHSLSGAVLEPDALDVLLPQWRKKKPSICVPVTRDQFFLMTGKRRIRLPTPPQMKNHGNYMVSLGELTRFMAEEAEKLGVDVFPGFAASDALIENDQVVGVQVGDMGVNKDGSHAEHFTPGVNIKARFTLMAEGCRGHVSKQLIKQFELDKHASPQTYGLGFKELWQLPEGRVTRGLVQHTVGWPLKNDTYGGSFLYHLDNHQLYLGFVIGLDYKNPRFEPYKAFQAFKEHPSIARLIEGGELLEAGARTLVEGGYQSLPKLEMPGALLLGDAAGTLNVPKIKGVHMAMHSGLLAAEYLCQHKKTDGFDDDWHQSKSAKELKAVRNIRPGFTRGLWIGLANAALETATGGRIPYTLKNHDDAKALKTLAATPELDVFKPTLEPKTRLANVYYANTAHDENQPVHLKVIEPDICTTRCTKEYGNPCTKFCPAHVYEMVENEQGESKLHINAANCVHCKACDIKDPYQIINWVAPEGGSGPNYSKL